MKTRAQRIIDEIVNSSQKKQSQRLRKIARSLDLEKIPKSITIPTEYMI